MPQPYFFFSVSLFQKNKKKTFIFIIYISCKNCVLMIKIETNASITLKNVDSSRRISEISDPQRSPEIKDIKRGSGNIK